MTEILVTDRQPKGRTDKQMRSGKAKANLS